MTDLYPSCLIQYYQLKFNYKQKSHEINVAVFLDKSFPTAISSVNVAVLSFPIQHIHSNKVENRLFSLYAAIFVYINNLIRQSEDKRSILIDRIYKKKTVGKKKKKTLAMVRLNYNLVIFA